MIGVGAVAAGAAPSAQVGGVPEVIFAAIPLVNGAAAALLFVGGRRDHRALLLGGAFVLVAASFSIRPIGGLADGLRPFSWAGFVGSLLVEGFSPYFMWRFAAVFPAVSRFGRSGAIYPVMTRVSLAAGVLALVAGLAKYALSGTPDGLTRIPLVELLRRDGPVYWPTLLGLSAAAFGALVSKVGRASIEERRRVSLLVLGVAIGLLPYLIVTAWTWLSSAFAAFVGTPAGLRRVGWFAYPPILLAPAIISYAVVVDQALDVRLVVRKAVRYALARYSVVALAALPFAVLVGYLYLHRDRTLADVFGGSDALVLAGATLLGVLALFTRSRLVRAIDRVFFREQYDAREILGGLVQRAPLATDAGTLGQLVVSEIDRALHPRSASLLLFDRGRMAFVDPKAHARPLAGDSPIVKALSGSRDGLLVDWEHTDPLIRSLPDADATWLADTGFRLILPVVTSAGRMAGMLCLGEKLSELPFSAEDRTLLVAIATSAGLALENRALRSGDGPAGSGPVSARECTACGRLGAAEVTTCEACGSTRVPAAVPLEVAGKYRVTRRIGRGGMGVVYRATDRTLQREVAVKTLPWMSPRYAHRLRREARAMASLSHRHLAQIYAVESWQGVPLLVLEYLSGGTLADRLAQQALSLSDAVELGLMLAEVAAYIHDRGILHRDIKPSNIGYTGAGEPKLLDFGVAHILEATRRPAERSTASQSLGPGPASEADPTGDPTTTITHAGEVVGTPLYLSPEALEGKPPAAGFDLWSIAMVLYEGLTGANPMDGNTRAQVLSKVAAVSIPDVREHRPDLPEEVARFFAGALHRDPRERPATARELRQRLAAIPRH
ncbi:MAG: protein kinase [Gemmatimonadales bacterium]